MARASEKADENPSRQRTPRSGIRRDQKNGEATQRHGGKCRQRQNLRRGEKRCRDCNRSGDEGRSEPFVFHRHSTKVFIGAERYSG